MEEDVMNARSPTHDRVKKSKETRKLEEFK